MTNTQCIEKLKAELKAQELILAQMQQEYDQARARWTPAGPSRAELDAAQGDSIYMRIGSQQATVQSIRDRIEQAEREAAFHAQVSQSNTVVKAYLDQLASLHVNLNVEKERAERIRAGAADMRRLTSEGIKAAEAKQSAAATAYTQAADDKAIKAAEKLMVQATEAGSKARREAEDSGHLLTLLDAQLEATDGFIVRLDRDIAETQRLMYENALLPSLRAQWDQAIAQLHALGAKVDAVGRRAGHTSLLYDLYLPALTPGASDLTRDTVREAGEALSDDDLLPA